MTFPSEHLESVESYRAAAALPAGASDEELAIAAAKRRDLAVEGYLPIRDALIAGDDGPLRRFRERAAEIVAERVSSWNGIVEQGPLAQAQNTLELLARMTAGDSSHLDEGFVVPGLEPAYRFGMCGNLRAYEVATY